MAESKIVRVILITIASAIVGSFQIYNQAVVNNLVPAFTPWFIAVKEDGRDDFDWYVLNDNTLDY